RHPTGTISRHPAGTISRHPAGTISRHPAGTHRGVQVKMDPAVSTRGMTKNLSKHQWLVRIFLLQLLINLFFLGITQLSQQALPVLYSLHIDAYNKTLHQFLLLGIFPWALVGLLAVAFAYCAYNQNKNAFFNTLVEPLFPHPTKSRVWIFDFVIK